ncbi:5-deoxy-glucuronate isomerase [Plantactinospora endophytica]|uniref:5-deoxy-glucuronate isomerase n=1 Tax=Plantactinospora endophytica TaxID=673535 RepID=A0ABQ4E6B6_9ACTN|nr:5-deoxy-glucuronate isomerase [Plantactinospora endophytica]GIG89852.1 5-deoxy-glucuronate isomerase [Plantactinospora endophytica]
MTGDAETGPAGADGSPTGGGTGRCYWPAGSAAVGRWSVALDPQRCGWTYTGLRVVELPPGARVGFDTGPDEVIVLPLAGSAVLHCTDSDSDSACGPDTDRAPAGGAGGGWTMELAGRSGVFAGISDFGYLPPGTRAELSSADGGRFALPAARARRRFPARYGPADGVRVELRGAGTCSRQVNNFATPETFETDRLIACEVLTPDGNWSSYPPHKHDEPRAGQEVVLEEIYYFEVGIGPTGTPGYGYHRIYGTVRRPIDVLAEVRSGDTVLVPYGWHGPSIAAPGHPLYYLNAMAGPAEERSWLISDDPAHAWVRASWAGRPVDPRLPLTSHSR